MALTQSIRKGSQSEIKKSERNINADTKNVNDKCRVCSEKVTGDHKGIECEMCKHWFHAVCEDIEDEEYEVLSRHTKGKIHWYCTVCNDSSVEILRLVKNLQEKVQQTETKLEIITKDFTEKFTQLEYRLQKHSTDVDKQMEKLKAQEDKEFRDVHKICQQLESKFVDEQKANKVVDFKLVVKEQMEEEMKKSAEFTEKLVENKLVCSQTQIQAMNRKLEETKSNLQEEVDKEARRDNIIIYRMPESVSDSNEERKVMDKRFVLKLLTKMEIGVEEEDIKGAFRLGKWIPEQNTQSDSSAQTPSNPRPMLVQLNSRTAKNLIMNNLFKLKHLESKYKNVVIAHDMTKNERKNCKTLVEDAKKTTTGGPFGKLHIQGQGNSRGNDNCPATPKLKYEGNQLVNSTNRNYEKLDNEEDILFLYTNADCLPNKLQELKQLLVHFEKSPDIISLTEIKHKNKWEMNSAELTIDGYQMFTNDLEANNRGILVYVKEHLSCKQIFLSNIFGEYVLLQLDINKNKKK